MNRPKAIGTAGETAVVRVLRLNGWPSAERRALTGAQDCGDVTGTPGIVWEVKAGDAAKRASDGLVQLWLDQTEVERVNAGADVGVLVLARAGIGAPNAARWWAVMRWAAMTRLHDGTARQLDAVADEPVRLRLATVCAVLRSAGYGEPLHPVELDEQTAGAGA